MKKTLISKMVETFWVKLYLAGPIDQARQILRREAYEEGLCVTIEATEFIYTAGAEVGYVVGFINYPKFPKDPTEITRRAIKIGKMLMEETYQDSFCMMSPRYTEWYSRREA